MTSIQIYRLLMESPMARAVKFLASIPVVNAYQKPLSYSILRHFFNNLRDVPRLDRREDLWDEAMKSVDNAPITYIEFGVHKGYSIRYFAEHNNDPASRFIGLDSFEGLPEGWGGMPRAAFSTEGSAPAVTDKRITFIKGWFHDTWNSLHEEISSADDLIVHFDADLYSSTLFALAKIDTLGRPYTGIFDEFFGDETRALHSYALSHGAIVTFLGKVTDHGYPRQVLCRIRPVGAN